MANIVDRRNVDRHKSSENRKRFVDRYRDVLRRAVSEKLKKNSVTNPTGNRSVGVPADKISEPTFRPDISTGPFKRVFPGNERFNKGDSANKPSSGGSGQGSGAGNSNEVWEDEFRFVLTKDEFLDLLFEDMELPNFVKKNLKQSVSLVRQRAGYTKDGIPAMLSLKKTFENAIARRIAARAENNTKKPPFIDDVDLRYKRFDLVPKPDKRAVMFCVMDVSGSMGEAEKLISKKFFILLHLFLQKVYKNVEVVFIKHHTEATEVSEFEFFYSRETGGTEVSGALELVNTIITERYPPDSNNIYVAQASDGDNWNADNATCVDILENKLLKKLSYMAYINILNPRTGMRSSDLWHTYKPLEKKFGNIKSSYVTSSAKIYQVLKELFKKGGAV